MKIALITVGATHKQWAAQGEEEYLKRLRHYIDFDKIVVPDIKNTSKLTVDQQKQLEGEGILSKLSVADRVWLLDERGKEHTSLEFSAALQEQMNRGVKRLVFVIGGPYGFSNAVYARADGKLSFSKFTLPHDLIRVVFMEQLYRAFTIQRGEPYHHE